MATVDITTELLCGIDDAMMTDVPRHSQQALAPSELVTMELLHPGRVGRSAERIGKKRLSNRLSTSAIG